MLEVWEYAVGEAISHIYDTELICCIRYAEHFLLFELLLFKFNCIRYMGCAVESEELMVILIFKFD